MDERIISKTLTGLVEGFMARTRFFRVWKKGLVEPGMARSFLLSFDALVKSFPSLIAAGAARARDERTRTVLAVNLFQECGEGDVRRTHYAIYRKYLATAGLGRMEGPEPDFAVQWRDALLAYISGPCEPSAAMGALAAGEFLAQPVLSRIYPILKALYPEADQEYFTKHLDLETEHVREITELLAGQVHDEKEWNNVLDGFKFGLKVWETYFENLAEFISKTQVQPKVS